MKISEMTNDQAAEAMIRLAGPFASLADDEEIMTMLDEIKAMKLQGIAVMTATIKMIPRFVTFGLAKHKRDLYEIVGALLQKPASAVGKLNMLQTIKAVEESFDEDTQSFFTQFGAARMSKGGKSSAASSGTDGTAGTR